MSPEILLTFFELPIPHQFSNLLFMGKLLKALTFVALLLVSLQPLVAKRVALVIGNAVYDREKPMREQPNLHNTREDADLVHSYDYGRVKGKSFLKLGLAVIDRRIKITTFDEKVSK